MDITKFTRRKLLVGGLLLLILIALATLPFYGPSLGLSTRELFIPALSLVYVILAVSWAMFSGPTGYMSLGTAAFFGVGIYTMALLNMELPLGVIIVIAALVSFIIALLTGLVTLRLKGIYFAIFTFGLVVLIGQLVLYYEIHIVGIRGRVITPTSYEAMYYIMLGLAVATLLAVYFIRRSRWGLALQSIGGNEEAAAHMGVNTTMVKVITFAVSAIFMGAAGAAYAARLVFVDPTSTFDVSFSFMPILMAVFGGMGHLSGPVIGAATFSILERWLSIRFPSYYSLIFGTTLIIVILYLPGGLLGLVPKLRNRLGGPISKLLNRGKEEQHANT